MAVDSDLTFALQQYRQDIARALNVDGYFYGRIQGTGDASGGIHRVRFAEPDDGQVATRCLWIVAYDLSTGYATGNVEVVGKLGGTDQEDRMNLAVTRQVVDTDEVMYLTNGGDLAGALRARGWMVPSFGPGSQNAFVTAYFANTNLTTVDARIFGYYMLLNP